MADPSEIAEMKRCPFCGCEEIRRESRIGFRAARPVHECCNCGAQGPLGERYDGHKRSAQDEVDAENLALWNTRAAIASMSTPEGEVEGRAREILAARYHDYGCDDCAEGLLEGGAHGPQEEAAIHALCDALSLPSTAREEVIEECAKLADEIAIEMDNEHNRSLGVAKDLVETAEDVAAGIRALKGKPPPAEEG